MLQPESTLIYHNNDVEHGRFGGRGPAGIDIPARVTPRVARQRRGLCAVGSDENGARRSWPKAVCLGFLRFGGARAAEAAAASAAKAGAERESAPQRCVCRGGLVRAAAGRGARRQDRGVCYVSSAEVAPKNCMRVKSVFSTGPAPL